MFLNVTNRDSNPPDSSPNYVSESTYFRSTWSLRKYAEIHNILATLTYFFNAVATWTTVFDTKK